MKQHVTEKELARLSNELIEKLFSICFPNKEWCSRHFKIALLSLDLTIGKMIEILNKKELITIEKGRQWVIKTTKIQQHQADELCDCLFEALKYVENEV